LAENVYNMDETGVMLSMPGSVKVLVGKDDRRNYRGARVKRTTVTAIECISADGRYLDPMIIWPASTHRSNWTTFPTPGWQYAYSDSGYTDSKISFEWLKRIFNPQTQERANKKPRVLICDGFSWILDHVPCDVAVFAPLKDAYREQVDRLERGGVNTIGKQHFTSLYSPARVRAFTPKNIKAGFAASGLLPFNPDRVLRHMPKPPAELNIPKADEVEVGPRQQDVELQTPVTPVSAEALMSLQSLIIQRDAHALDETSKQDLARHLQKFVNASQKSFAKGILQEDRIKFLTTINDEAKVRRSTRSLVLGKAKVMSYEDLEEARAKRAEKEAAKEAKGKGKRGRKCKSATSEVDEASMGKPNRGRKRKSAMPEAGALEPKAKEARTSNAPESARDSMAQMTGFPTCCFAVP
ncbi:hypothetical protein V500_06013, partial [Pseudogymnoascus sp. VKM F-4518 (FW-2643)]